MLPLLPVFGISTVRMRPSTSPEHRHRSLSSSNSCETIITKQSSPSDNPKLGTKEKFKSLRLSRPKSFLGLFHTSQEQAQPQPWYVDLFEPNNSRAPSPTARRHDSTLDTQDVIQDEPRYPPGSSLRGKRSSFFNSVGSKLKATSSLPGSSGATLSNFTFRRAKNSSQLTLKSNAVEPEKPLLNDSLQVQHSQSPDGPTSKKSSEYLQSGSGQTTRVQVLAETGFTNAPKSPFITPTGRRNRILTPLQEATMDIESLHHREESRKMRKFQYHQRRSRSFELFLQSQRRLAQGPVGSTNASESKPDRALEDPFVGSHNSPTLFPSSAVGEFSGGIGAADDRQMEILQESRTSSGEYSADKEPRPLERHRPLSQRPAQMEHVASRTPHVVEVTNATPGHPDADTLKEYVINEDFTIDEPCFSDSKSVSRDSSDLSNPFEDPTTGATSHARPASRLRVRRNTTSSSSTQNAGLQMSDIEEESEERYEDWPLEHSPLDLKGPSKRDALVAPEHQMMQALKIDNIKGDEASRTTSGDYYRRAAAVERDPLMTDELIKDDYGGIKPVSQKERTPDEVTRRFQECHPTWPYMSTLPRLRRLPCYTPPQMDAGDFQYRCDPATWDSFLSDTSIGSNVGVEDTETMNTMMEFEKNRVESFKREQERKNQRRRRFWNFGLGGRSSKDTSSSSRSSWMNGKSSIIGHKRVESSLD